MTYSNNRAMVDFLQVYYKKITNDLINSKNVRLGGLLCLSFEVSKMLELIKIASA